MGGLPTYFIVAIMTGGYLLGSIPVGVLATRFGGAGDLRKIGSGNIGATNVLRTGRRDLAAITLVGDAGKGAVAAMLAYYIVARQGGDLAPAQLAAALGGGMAFLGHVFPVWLRFAGGKGVATFFGVMLAVAWWPPAGLLAAITWLAMALLFRYSSLSALTAAALSPFYAFALHSGEPVIVLAVFMAVIIFIRHRENIARLLKGQEPKIGEKSAPPTATPS